MDNYLKHTQSNIIYESLCMETYRKCLGCTERKSIKEDHLCQYLIGIAGV